MVEKKTRSKVLKEALTPSLSGITIPEIRKKVMTAIHDQELDKSIETWLKKTESKKNIEHRDMELLSSIITEYMDSFIILGYNLEGERIVLQHHRNPKDYDALMELLKTVFFRHQNGGDDD